MKTYEVHFSASAGQQVAFVRAWDREHAEKKVRGRYPSAIIGLITLKA